MVEVQTEFLQQRGFVGLDLFHPAHDLDSAHVQQADNLIVVGGELVTRPGKKAMFSTPLADPVYAPLPFILANGISRIFFVSGLLFTLCASWFYIWANVGVIRFFLGEKRAEFNFVAHIVLPVLTSVALIYVCWQTFTNPAPTGRGAWALPIFLVWAGIGIAALLIMRARGREQWLLKAGEEVYEG